MVCYGMAGVGFCMEWYGMEGVEYGRVGYGRGMVGVGYGMEE